MINKNLNRLYLVVISLFFQACAPVYFPNRVNAPMINKAGDFNIEATMGATGFDAQTAFSPVNRSWA